MELGEQESRTSKVLVLVSVMHMRIVFVCDYIGLIWSMHMLCLVRFSLARNIVDDER